MVAQYLEGGGGSPSTDPALSLVPGSDTYLKSYRLSTPTGAAAFTTNYASIVISTADLGTLTLNGVGVNTSAFTGIAGTSFSRGIVDLPLGLFDLAGREPIPRHAGRRRNGRQLLHVRRLDFRAWHFSAR